MWTVAAAGLDALLAALLSPACAACDRLLDRPLRGPVCDACWSSLLPDTPPVCDRCGAPLPSWRMASIEAGCCPACRRGSRRITRMRSIGPYDGALRRLIHALKYGRRSSLGRPLGEILRVQAFDVLEGVTCVVPVPLHRARRRERGFNQAELIARALQRPVLRPLVRHRATPPQAHLPAARRFANVRDAFALRRAAWTRRGDPTDRIRDAIVLLVDDVVTTGATLEACARILLDAGVAEVRAVTAARADRFGRRGPSPAPT